MKGNGQQALALELDPFVVERVKVILSSDSGTADVLVAALQIIGLTECGVKGIGDPHLMGHRGVQLGEALARLLDQHGLDIVERTGEHT